jgi:hypothetical protein
MQGPALIRIHQNGPAIGTGVMKKPCGLLWSTDFGPASGGGGGNSAETSCEASAKQGGTGVVLPGKAIRALVPVPRVLGAGNPIAFVSYRHPYRT